MHSRVQCGFRDCFGLFCLFGLLALLGLLVVAACDVERDLNPARFAQQGGDGAGGGDAGDAGDVPCATALSGAARCGGDPAGAFSLEAVCGDAWLSATLRESGCDTVSIEAATQTLVGGTLTMEAGEYSLSWTSEVSLSFKVPGSCVGQCSLAEAQFGPILGSTTCSGDAPFGDCHCEYSGSILHEESGTYAESGSVLSLAPSGEAPVAAPFCRTDGVLRISRQGTGFTAMR